MSELGGLSTKEDGEMVQTISTRGHCEHSCRFVIPGLNKKVKDVYERASMINVQHCERYA